MKIKIVILISCVVLLLSGCSALTGFGALDAVNPLKDDKGIKTNVQLGKENNLTENKGLLNNRSDTKNETVNNIQADKVDQFVDYKDAPWLILAFAIAFAAPNPFAYFKNKREMKTKEEEIHELRNKVRKLYEDIARKVG